MFVNSEIELFKNKLCKTIKYLLNDIFLIKRKLTKKLKIS